MSQSATGCGSRRPAWSRSNAVVDYATTAFLGVRSLDALYRIYGRDAWGWPVGVANHLFADDADEAANRQSWSAWLNSVFVTEAVA